MGSMTEVVDEQKTVRLQLPMLLWVLAFVLVPCWAQWAAYYSFDEGKVYMRLKNDDIVPLNFSITGFDDLESFLGKKMDLTSGQSISAIAPPPENSTVFLHQGFLFAFKALDQESDYDVCGDGIFQLLGYNEDKNEWEPATDDMSFSDVSDVSYYEGSTILTSPGSNNIYIYGGRCPSSGKATDRLLSFDMEKFSFSNITTSTKPHGFYGATAQWAPNPQNSLVIGGRSNDGWLNMYQLATWNYDSGWSFQAVERNSSFSVNSRLNPMVLPIFSPLADNASSTFEKTYRPLAMLLIGGDDSKGLASPEWARLRVDTNTWAWEPVETDIDIADVIGAAVLFDTLVLIRDSGTKKRDGNGYTVLLYDINNQFEQVKSLSDNTKKTESSDSGSSLTTQKALIGTLVPVAALAMAAAVGFYLWKRKGSSEPEREDVLDAFDYQLGHFRTRSDLPADVPPPHVHRRLSASSESTLEAASIDSWVKKRQEYDSKRQRTVRRHSFLGLNETLNNMPEVDDESETSEPPEMRQVLLDPALPARVRQLRKSFSFTNTPPALPGLKKSTKGSYMGISDLPADDEKEDGSSCDEAMDVQVLVSSKRKSVLRVVNPDDKDDDSIRQRTPSK